jgi:hypothetical protein
VIAWRCIIETPSDYAIQCEPEGAKNLPNPPIYNSGRFIGFEELVGFHPLSGQDFCRAFAGFCVFVVQTLQLCALF